jgi:pimeloyl-ACP methyl ester carboxylesterase
MRVRGLLNGLHPWSDVWSRSGWRVQRHVDGQGARLLPPSGEGPMQGTEDECIAIATRRAPPSGRARAVVLLHGLLNDPAIMMPMARTIGDAGWAVANLAYPSTRLSMAVHARNASAAARALAEDGAREIAFVGHSLGGLVARAAIARATADGWRPGGLVLVGTPARGSAMASLFARLPGCDRLLGRGFHSVTLRGAADIPPPTGARVAIVAGGNGASGFNPLLAGDNDAVVTVAETRMQHVESAFMLVPAMHNPLMASRTTCAASLSFLQTGRLRA